LVGVSRQSYYEQIAQEGRVLLRADLVVNAVIAERRYLPKSGYRQLMPKLTTLLADLDIGRDAFIQILRNADLMQKQKRGGVRTTFSNHGYFVYENLISNLQVTNVLQVWVVDITYIRTLEGFLYLALVTDSFSRKIVGFDAADSLELEGSLRAIMAAIDAIPKHITYKLIHHSDRGAQYCSRPYISFLKSRNIQISMAATGNCYANAQAESINGRLKVEFLLDATFPTKASALVAIKDAIHTYNTYRPHGKLNYQTPAIVHQNALDILIDAQRNQLKVM
jgi:putative transposase